MRLADVMDQVDARLGTIANLRHFAFPPDSFTPPAAVVSYPDEYVFDETYGRGMDSMVLPVILMVGKVVDRAARNQLLAYADVTGPASVKAVLESGVYTAFHTLRVMSAEFAIQTFNATDYLGVEFLLHITGSGS